MSAAPAGAGPAAAGSPAAFDLCGPLPAGTTVLEASAGTGKTFTIASLAARYVAEGVASLDGLMLVTFTRAATQELRERVRERLGQAASVLAGPPGGAGADPLLALLADVPDGERAARRRRVQRALAGFDGATIATHHGFCQQMLAGLGVAGDTDTDVEFVERIDDLVEEVVGDLYLRRFADEREEPRLSLVDARQVARQAMADRQASLAPAGEPTGSPAQLRFGMAAAVRAEVDRRKRDRRLLDYDDLLERLRDALDDPVRGEAACARLRERYQVVLVDEFQDTDPVQWRILRRAFHGHRTLVLIGDPKQAIYAFRGADLVTYLGAVREAGDRRTLARNWRSDGPLVAGVRAVFGAATMGDRVITVPSVSAEHEAPRLSGAGAALRLRVVTRGDALPGDLTARGQLRAEQARRLVVADLVDDVVGLLSGPARLSLGASPRPVGAADLAVLTRTNDTAVAIRDALLAAGVPAVHAGATSVFRSPAAGQWLALLQAVEQPHRTGLVRAAALTSFAGWSAARLGTAGEDELDALAEGMRGWRDVLVGRGVAALAAAVTAGTGLAERVLARPDGERLLTDLRHIGQALHAAATAERLGPAALVEWLRARIAEAGDDLAEERSRRLESDADAVQVLTVHTSKGLQFPIVYVPSGWDRWVGPPRGTFGYHDDAGRRIRYVGGDGGTGYADAERRWRAEESAEDLRLLYVALTRAQCQVVTWWVPATTAACSPLHRLLFAQRAAAGGEPPAEVAVPDDVTASRRLRAWAGAAGGCVEVANVGEPAGARWSPPAGGGVELAAAAFDRTVDSGWRRTSYTGLTALAHEAALVGSEPEGAGVGDEPAVAELGVAEDPGAAAAASAAAALPSPMAELPAGAAFGIVVHEVLEEVDLGAGDLAAEVAARCAQAGAPDGLAAALLAVYDTPLGPLAGGRRLRDVGPADRLAECAFELPMAGGDEPVPGGGGDVAALGRLFDEHLPAGDPLAGYGAALCDPLLGVGVLRGYLTGSIDAVLRADGRYLVVDYKTNWLGRYGPAGPLPLTTADYTRPVMAAEMRRAHYPLQALLYSVALHRYLRWRLPGYDPGTDLGGVLYLFLRGMAGAATPAVDGTPCGVFAWSPPAGLIVAASALLDGAA